MNQSWESNHETPPIVIFDRVVFLAQYEHDQGAMESRAGNGALMPGSPA